MKLCPGCRRLSESSPCAACKRARDRRRGAPRTRGYDDAWAALSRLARRLHPYCAQCGSTDDLTVDHLVPLAAGGKRTGLTLDDVQVLCRPCNSAKGARTPTEGPKGGGGGTLEDPQDHRGGGRPVTLSRPPEPPTPPARPAPGGAE